MLTVGRLVEIASSNLGTFTVNIGALDTLSIMYIVVSSYYSPRDLCQFMIHGF